MTVAGVGGAPKGKPKSAEHKAKISKAQDGKDNSNYKDGRRSYRKIAGAKDNQITHHIDGDRSNNKKSNLKNLSGRKGRNKTNSAHERLTDRGAGRKLKTD